MKTLFLVVALCGLLTMTTGCLPPTQDLQNHWRVKYENDKEKADQAFATGDYATALKIYDIHARSGSKFSQYRLAYMYENGLGVEQSLVDAFAWADLAAEEGTRSLVSYRNQLAEKLTINQLTTAQTKAAALYAKHSTYTIMEKTYEKSRQVIQSCGGSRVGNTCDRLIVIRGGGIHTRVSFQNGLPVGTPGFLFIAPYKHDLRISKQYIKNYGRAEFGEFRVVEDEVDENAPDGSE